MGKSVTRCDVIRTVLERKQPPYVPWDIAFSPSAAAALARHLNTDDLDTCVGNHFLYLAGRMTDLAAGPDGTFKDRFGVTWTYAPDSESYTVCDRPLPEPDLAGYVFPNPDEPGLYDHLPARLAQSNGQFNIFAIGYTLFERAWTLRGMEDFMLDLVLRPRFVHDLLDAITEVNIAQLRHALPMGFDCVHFGDDWGSQKGLLISPAAWRQFLRPRLQRLFDIVRQHGLYVSVHSCGDIHSILDDLFEMGVSIVNPFQPEPMDVWDLFERYKGRLTFHGGLSSQQTLPYGDVHRVQAETRRLLDAGRTGGYVFASGHGIGPEVPLENVLAMMQVLHAQPGFPGQRIA